MALTPPLRNWNHISPNPARPPCWRTARRVTTRSAACATALDGLGKPGQAPPLAGSEWVDTKDFQRLASHPAGGLSGQLSVKGQNWSLSMPAMGAAMSDADLADVLTYIHSSWGNKQGPVTADDVKAIRAKLGAHPQPFTGETLKALPE